MKKVMLYLAALLFLGMPSLCFGQGYVTGSITTTGATCTPATNCVSIPVPKNYGGASFTISGTYSGTLNFEATGDGTNYSALNVNPVGGGSAVTTTTSTGTWVINISGLVAVRVRASALASGSATVTIQLSIASAGSIGGGNGGGGSSASIAGNQNAIYASPQCPVTNTANCYFVNANGKVLWDCNWTNTLFVVTCSDGTFTAADVGKVVWGSNVVKTGFTSFQTAAVQVPQGTITSINSATSINVSLAATATQSSNLGMLTWGTEDTANLTAAWAAAVAACQTLYLPAGEMLTNLPQFNIAGTTVTGCTTGAEANRAGVGVHGADVTTTESPLSRTLLQPVAPSERAPMLVFSHRRAV